MHRRCRAASVCPRVQWIRLHIARSALGSIIRAPTCSDDACSCVVCVLHPTCMLPARASESTCFKSGMMVLSLTVALVSAPVRYPASVSQGRSPVQLRGGGCTQLVPRGAAPRAQHHVRDGVAGAVRHRSRYRGGGGAHQPRRQRPAAEVVTGPGPQYAGCTAKAYGAVLVLCVVPAPPRGVRRSRMGAMLVQCVLQALSNRLSRGAAVWEARGVCYGP